MFDFLEGEFDIDGIDLGLFNDRPLLGLKGTMSEAELHLLAGRMQGAETETKSRSPQFYFAVESSSFAAAACFRTDSIPASAARFVS